MNPLPILILLILLIMLAWLNPTLTYLAGRLAIILAGLIVGVFFGSFAAMRRRQNRWTIGDHYRDIIRLILDQTK